MGRAGQLSTDIPKTHVDWPTKRHTSELAKHESGVRNSDHAALQEAGKGEHHLSIVKYNCWRPVQGAPPLSYKHSTRSDR